MEEYYYLIDCRNKNSTDNWKKLKISNETFYDNFETRMLIVELNKQDQEYEYQNYELVEVDKYKEYRENLIKERVG